MNKSEYIVLAVLSLTTAAEAEEQAWVIWNTYMWLFPNKTLFISTDSWMAYHFHMSEYSFNIFNHLKNVKVAGDLA